MLTNTIVWIASTRCSVPYRSQASLARLATMHSTRQGILGLSFEQYAGTGTHPALKWQSQYYYQHQLHNNPIVLANNPGPQRADLSSPNSHTSSSSSTSGAVAKRVVEGFESCPRVYIRCSLCVDISCENNKIPRKK